MSRVNREICSLLLDRSIQQKHRIYPKVLIKFTEKTVNSRVVSELPIVIQSVFSHFFCYMGKKETKSLEKLTPENQHLFQYSFLGLHFQRYI